MCIRDSTSTLWLRLFSSEADGSLSMLRFCISLFLISNGSFPRWFNATTYHPFSFLRSSYKLVTKKIITYFNKKCNPPKAGNFFDHVRKFIFPLTISPPHGILFRNQIDKEWPECIVFLASFLFPAQGKLRPSGQCYRKMIHFLWLFLTVIKVFGRRSQPVFLRTETRRGKIISCGVIFCRQ